MHSHEKRSFMAEMTIKYCDGKSRKAESVFGWGRNIVETGLGEIRTGIICLGSQPACCGRKLWEEKEPQAAEALNSIADIHSQQDPAFSSAIKYTRLTAKEAIIQLKEQGFKNEQLPSPSTMAEVLNRLGYRLRKILKAKPQKKIEETEAIFENIKKKDKQTESNSVKRAPSVSMLDFNKNRDRIPPLRGGRGVFVLEVLTHTPPYPPQGGNSILVFVKVKHTYRKDSVKRISMDTKATVKIQI